jgi:hypothetical protein
MVGAIWVQVAAAGKYIAIVSTTVETSAPLKEIEPAIKLLGDYLERCARRPKTKVKSLSCEAGEGQIRPPCSFSSIMIASRELPWLEC